MHLFVIGMLDCYAKNTFNLSDTVAAIPQAMFNSHGKYVKINFVCPMGDFKVIKIICQ